MPFFVTIRINCQTLHLCQTNKGSQCLQRSWIPSRYVQHWFFFHILPHRTTRNVATCTAFGRSCRSGFVWSSETTRYSTRILNWTTLGPGIDRWQDFLLLFIAQLKWPLLLKLLVFHMNSFGKSIWFMIWIIFEKSLQNKLISATPEIRYVFGTQFF